MVTGRRGSGKTWLLNEYLNRREPRVLALDAFGDFGGLAPIPPRRPVVTWEPDQDDAEYESQTRRYPDVDDALRQLRTMRARRVSLQPDIGGGVSSLDYGEYVFTSLTWRKENWDLLVGLDEFSLWSTPRASRALQVLVMQGRRLGVRMAVGIQRIGQAADVVLSEATDIVWMRCTRPRDLDVAEEWAGPEVADALPTLGVGECIHTAF